MTALLTGETVANRDLRLAQELERIRGALLDPATPGDRYCQFYVAQQAIDWIIDPRCAAAPFDSIMGGQVQPLIWGKNPG